MLGIQKMDKDKQLVEQWWINLYDSIEPAKEKINYSKEYRKIYQKSPKYKEYRKKYQQSPKYKEYLKEYQKSPKYKKYQKEYYQKNRLKILSKKRKGDKIGKKNILL